MSFQEMSQDVIDKETAITRAESTQSSIGDSFIDSAVSVFKENPTTAIYDYFSNKAEVAYSDLPEMKGADANAKYQLQGEYSFDEDETINEVEAQIRQERKLEKERIDALTDDVNARHPVMGRVSSFFGGIAGGMADPVGLVVGAGVGSLAAKAGGRAMVAAGKALNQRSFIRGAKTLLRQKEALSNTALAVREGVEATVGILAVDAPALALQKDMYNEDGLERETMFMLLGGALGSAALSVGVRKAQKHLGNTTGDNAKKAIDDMVEHIEAEQKMDVKHNPDFVPDVHETVITTPRDGQLEYNYEPIASGAQARETAWYAVEDTGKGKIFSGNKRGLGAVELVDTPNHNVNYAKDVGDTEVKLKVHKVALNAETNLFDGGDESIAAMGYSLRSFITNNFKDRYFELSAGIDKVRTIDDLTDFLGNIEGIKDADLVANQILAKADFDGFITPGLGPKGDAIDNRLFMLDKDVLLGEGEKPFYFAGGDIGTLAGNKLEVLETTPIKDFDPNVPRNKEVMDKVRSKQLAEANRIQDPKQSNLYDEMAMEFADDPRVKELAKTSADDVLNEKIKGQSEILDDTEAVALLGEKEAAQLKEKMSKVTDDAMFEKVNAQVQTCLLGKFGV